MKLNESTLATIGGLLTTLGVAWAIFLTPEHEIPLGIKLLIAAMPALGGLITKSFHGKK